MRGALVGFGNVAIHAHLPVWRQNSRFSIQAVVEPVADRAGLVREILPRARVYADMDTLIAEEPLDFVDICTPPCFHEDLMLKACRAGLHVFCEKPLVASAGGLDEIQKAAYHLDCVIFTVNNWKYAPLWTEVREIIGRGRIGTVREVDLFVLRTPNSGGGASDWRRCPAVAGGGILLDHGWHHLYLILSLIRDRPTRISAKMDYLGTDGSRLEETVDLAMEFAGANARLHLTWRAPSRKNYGTIKGDRGTVFINDDHLLIDVHGIAPSRYDFFEPLSRGSHHVDWMRPVIEDFHREVLDVHARGANFEEAKWCARLTDLAYRSHREGACFIRVDDQVS